jgi:hypothetical protein
VAARKADAAGVDPDAIAGFEKWIGEREGMARQTRLMGISSRHSGW